MRAEAASFGNSGAGQSVFCGRSVKLQDVVDQDGPLPPNQVRGLGAGLAEGLAAIHACGLVHRDLKPGNVILAGDGLRIIDFGIARAADSTALTTAGSVLGTYAYMSPEQIRGDSAGPASDVFSLGGVLAFAATGRPPFAGGAPASVMYGIVTEPPDLAGLADTRLRELITSCLAKAPRARPAVRAVLASLSSIAPVPATASPQPPGVTAADRASATTYPPAPPATGPGQWPGLSQTSTAPRMAPPEQSPSVAPARLPVAGPLHASRTRRRMAIIATVAVAAVLAVVLPVLLFKSSPGSAAGRQNKTDSVSDPAAAGPGAVGNLSANDHAANSARGYNRA